MGVVRKAWSDVDSLDLDQQHLESLNAYLQNDGDGRGRDAESVVLDRRSVESIVKQPSTVRKPTSSGSGIKGE